MNKKIEYIWISKLKISYKEKIRLIKELGSIDKFFCAKIDELIDLNVKDDYIARILDKELKESSFKDFEYVQKHCIDIIGIEDKNYPNKLDSIFEKPICFYIRGNIGILDNESVGIVGSRMAIKESLDVTKNVARIFSQNGINVVSGLARGIDKYAHLGCLEINSKEGAFLKENRHMGIFKTGKTIAVLGSGIDEESFYPLENKKVYERILESGGAILSEYPLFTKATPYNFPYRNRIISGLSDKIFVIQASLKSGSLITVNYALDQGKDVYVYNSSNINKDCFLGNKLLIEEGANYFKIT